MLEQLGHEIWVGDAAEIRRLARRKQKNDKKDANLILQLMVENRFPRLHRRSARSREILKQVGYRHKLVMRTMAKNSVKAIALGAGLVKRSQYYSQAGRQKLEMLNVTASVSRQAEARRQ